MYSELSWQGKTYQVYTPDDRQGLYADVSVVREQRYPQNEWLQINLIFNGFRVKNWWLNNNDFDEWFVTHICEEGNADWRPDLEVNQDKANQFIAYKLCAAFQRA